MQPKNSCSVLEGELIEEAKVQLKPGRQKMVIFKGKPWKCQHALKQLSQMHVMGL
jgi:hypothetical protein